MRRSFPWIAVIVCFSLFASCKKEKAAAADCFPNVQAIRHLTNAPATVKVLELQYYIIEKNSIDLKLIPCVLPEAFRVNDLAVLVSGDVKPPTELSVCCIEYINLTEINRQ